MLNRFLDKVQIELDKIQLQVEVSADRVLQALFRAEGACHGAGVLLRVDTEIGPRVDSVLSLIRISSETA